MDLSFYQSIQPSGYDICQSDIIQSVHGSSEAQRSLMIKGKMLVLCCYLLSVAQWMGRMKSAVIGKPARVVLCMNRLVMINQLSTFRVIQSSA
jgi:hypothetical protein